MTTQKTDPVRRVRDDEHIDEVDQDRGSVRKDKNPSRRAGIAFVAVLLILAALYTTHLMLPKEVKKDTITVEEPKAPDKGTQARLDTKVPALKEPPPPAPPPTDTTPSKDLIQIVPKLGGGGGQPSGGQPYELQAQAEPPDGFAKSRGAGMLASNALDTTAPNTAGGRSGSGFAGGANDPSMTARQSGDNFQAKLKPIVTEGVRAQKLPNRSLVVTKGTTLGVVHLDTAVSTEQPGMLIGTLARDVRSADGQVVLMTAGSRLTGEYHSGVEIGDESIFVLWTRFEDLQTGVVINLDSPGTDALGRAGLSGNIDTKFWTRFGAAIMFSGLSDIPAWLNSRRAGNSGTTVNAFPNTTTAATDSVKSVLEIYKNVRPTLRQNQGADVSIILARDLDFRSVYKLSGGEKR